MTNPSVVELVDVPSMRPAVIETPVPGDPRLARLSLNQETIRAWSVREVVEACVRAGVPSVGLWREPVAAAGLAESARMVREAGLRVSSLCRAGFMTAADPEAWTATVDEAKLAIDEAATLEAACLPIVPGGIPDGSTDVAGARRRFVDGLDALVPYATDRGVRLGVEPLHPMQCADRGVVCTLDHALDIAEDYPADVVGVVVDTYNVWWDPNVGAAIARAGVGGRIVSYQVNDWILPLAAETRLSRGMMGDGYIGLADLGADVAAAGYAGDVEVEIFNAEIWAAPPDQALATILRRYVQHCALT